MHASRRRASGLIRTIVVALATLAILLVCFSIYQYGQMEASTTASSNEPRLPPVPTQAADDATVAAENVPGVTVGPSTIGPGRNVRLAFYEKEGTRVRFEVAVRSWTPIEGTVDEFLLIEPEIRLRSNAGNAVRVTAQKGILEAARKASGGLDPRRGRLSGQVLIEFDRLTEEDRRKLPEERRGAPDPSEIIQVAVEEISFDLEYAKVSVPGELRLWGRDVELRASDLELRINEAASRVEHLRVARGGRLELRESAENLGLDLGADQQSSQRTTVVEWLRATLAAKMEAGLPSTQAKKTGEEVRTVAAGEQDIPVFRLQEEKESAATKVPDRYFARFENEVIATQEAAGDTDSRLEASILEVFRQLTAEDRSRVSKPSGDTLMTPSTGAPAAASAPETLALQWSGRLTVEALSASDSRWPGSATSLVVASGSPARLSNPEGEATCGKLVFDGDSSTVTLFADENGSVVVCSAGQGDLHATEVVAQRQGDAFEARVIGPGTLVRHREAGAPIGPVSTTESAKGVTVDFERLLELRGRYVSVTQFDFSEGVSTRRRRIVDKAIFQGRVKARQEDTGVTAHQLEIDLGPGSTRAGSQTIESLRAKGEVVMVQGPDRLSAEEVEIPLMPDVRGRWVPASLIAIGDVSADQGDRAIRAGEKLIVDFETVSSHDAGTGEDASAASAIPTERGRGVKTAVAVQRLRAKGDVSVVDPAEALDLVAAELDCTVRNGREIETAQLRGAPDRPANVNLKSMSVIGPEVTLHVPDDWAEVPGAGRMTLQSHRDLDGRKLETPVPIAITWGDRMKYQGRENRAVFLGSVHAASQSKTTVDCQRLDVELEEAPAGPAQPSSKAGWSFWKPLAGRFLPRKQPKDTERRLPGSTKQVAALVATGKVNVQTLEMEEASEELKTRVTMHGPKLSVNLREEVSKLTIEGAGDLFMEDFRIASEPREASAPGADLFNLQADAGPFKTLIEWQDLMWYDFSIDQTRFEGGVQLKHFSGMQLASVFRIPGADHARMPSGHQTYLTCDVLSADFHGRKQETAERETRQLGRLSSDRLRQFLARGRVLLEATSHNLSLSADSVNFDKDRMQLSAHGSTPKRARILVQKPGEYPQDYSAEWFVYDLAKRSVQAPKPVFEGR